MPDKDTRFKVTGPHGKYSVTARSVALEDGCLLFQDEGRNVIAVIASGQWYSCCPALEEE